MIDAAPGERLSSGQVGRIPEAGYQPPRPGMEGSTRASPEQQEQYNKLVNLGVSMLYNKKFLEPATKAMRNLGRDQTDRAVAMVASNIGTSIFSRLHKQGVEIDPAVQFHGGHEIFQAVLEVADTIGMDKPTNGGEDAFYKAATITARNLAAIGAVKPEDGKRMLMEFKELEPTGALDEVIAHFSEGPGLGSAAQAPSAPPSPPQQQPTPAPRPGSLGGLR